jgi:RHS repeat-associated protein
VQYQLGDHLGSSNVVVNADGSWINREEFTPYGETSFGMYAGKRYRFTGKERDEESGFNYHGARYYSSYLAHFLSNDPLYTSRSVDIDASKIQNLSGYLYARNNPIKYVDPSGLQSKPEGYSPALEDTITTLTTVTAFASPGALKLNEAAQLRKNRLDKAINEVLKPTHPGRIMDDGLQYKAAEAQALLKRAKWRSYGAGALKTGVWGGVGLGFGLVGAHFEQKKEYGRASAFNLLSLSTSIAAASGTKLVLFTGGALSLSAQGLAIAGAFIGGYALGTSLDKWLGASDFLSDVMGRENRAISKLIVSRYKRQLQMKYETRLKSQAPLAESFALKIRSGLIDTTAPGNQHLLYTRTPVIWEAVKWSLTHH